MASKLLAQLDAELIERAKPILVLKHLNWPDCIEHQFLTKWRAGRPALPVVEYAIPPWDEQISALDDVARRSDVDDPTFQFLRRTAWSYAEAGRMLMAVGTPEFMERSINLYGRPNDPYETQSFTGVEAAQFLLDKTDPLLHGNLGLSRPTNMNADFFAQRLRLAVDQYFTDDKIEVVVDNELSSKAIAGATRIRIRGSAMFSELDFDQLYHHEALVHTATAINGRRQPNLKSLRLGAPRTTRTQEGLAVFAEIATRSIDIRRLRRIALRILALKRVIEGADFIECFQFFLESGYDEREAYKSTQRIFRGGNVKGGVAFTKDSVYLKGLMEIHVLFNLAIRDNRPEIIRRLFAGRLAHGDTLSLGTSFESGFLEQPRYVPPWAIDLGRLAALLAYSSFMMSVNLAAVTFDQFVEAANRSEGA